MLCINIDQVHRNTIAYKYTIQKYNGNTVYYIEYNTDTNINTNIIQIQYNYEKNI